LSFGGLNGKPAPVPQRPQSYGGNMQKMKLKKKGAKKKFVKKAVKKQSYGRGGMVPPKAQE
jgi:hypothetical protein